MFASHPIRNAALALTAIVGLCGTASAQSFGHVHRVTQQMESDARELRREIAAHYPAPYFRHLNADAARVEQLADHIHHVLDRGGSVRHLRSDVNELARLVRHVEELVYRTGFGDPRAVVHVRGSLARLSRSVYHLERDLAALDRDPGCPHETRYPRRW